MNNLINLIKEYMDDFAGDETCKEAIKFIKNTRDAILARQNDATPKYMALSISQL